MGIELSITGETKLTGLVGGSTITGSFSPMMHTASFKEIGINAVYISFPINFEDLESAVKGLEAIAVGYNVTMPYKTHICQFLDDLSPAAELMGAVNTVEIRDGKSLGHNTDGAGFVENLRLLGVNPKEKIVTVIGAGGAGSAIFTQLALDEVSEVHIFNIRDGFWDATEKRISSLAAKTGVAINLHDLDDRDMLKESIRQSNILVNATHIGAGKYEDQSIVDEKMLHDGLVVADTVYKPLETKLIKMAKAKGLLTAPGAGMLLQQAALAERIWFGVDMPLEKIRKEFF